MGMVVTLPMVTFHGLCGVWLWSQFLCVLCMEIQDASAKFVHIMTQCLSFHSAFTGSINLSTLTTVSRSPPLLILLEPKSNAYGDHEEKSKSLVSSEKESQKVEAVGAREQLPRMPPWHTHSATRLYNTLACIVRLVGRAAISGQFPFLAVNV